MKWDLTYLFKTYEDFLQATKDVKEYLTIVPKYKGTLSEEKNLVEYLKLKRQFKNEFARIYQYAALKSDLNKKDVSALKDLNNCLMILYSLQELCAFEDPEMILIGREKVLNIIDKNEDIKEFKFIMESFFDKNEHILNEESEQILSYYSPLSETGAELYSSLAVGDNENEIVNLSNKQNVVVTQGNYQSLINEAATEDDRRIIFEAIFKKYQVHKNTFAAIYKSVLDADKAYAKARKYNSSLEAHLDANKIPTSVYHNLVEVAGTCNESLKKYLKLRKEYLGLETYHTYDRFLSLAKTSEKYTYEEAKELFFNSISHFPSDFKEKAHEVLKDGFVDVFESDGKRTGAYSAAMTNIHPFILLNHDSTLEACFTLAHEAGHSIHSMYSWEAQPTMLQDYTIFVAEIASTFNEHNLLDYILKSTESTKEAKIVVIEKALDSIMSTFYRQTLFAEFELIAHNKCEAGEAINYEVLSNIMIDLYKKYYDIDIKAEVLKEYVWAYIPHMYYTPFYVYQYATSFAASFKIYKDVKENVPGAFDRYINLLKSGGSAYPMDEAKAAGVDFNKKETFMAVCERTAELVKELEELLKQ